MSSNNLLWPLLKKYKWKSVFLKYALMLFTFIILPLSLITFFIFYQGNELSRKHYIDSQCSIYEDKISSQFSEVINSIYSTQDSLFKTSYMQRYLSNYDTLLSHEIAVDANQVRAYIQNTCMSSSYIDSIYIYNHNTNYILSTSSSGFVDNFYDNELFLNTSSNIVQSHIKYRTPTINSAKKEYLSFYCDSSSYGYPYDAIVYNIDCNSLLETLYSHSSFIDKIYIADTSDSILYSNDTFTIEKNFNKYNNQDNMVVIPPISAFKIAFIYNNSDNFTNTYISIIVIYTLVIILLLSICIYLISKRFFQAFADVINIMQADGIEDEHYENEFQYLLSNIKSIMNRNSTFENEFAIQYSKLKHAQTIALQSQIKPHFIFNVINLISLIDIKQNGAPTDISKITDALSDILRALMNSDNYIISLERELSYVDKYLTLQNIKYKNKFNYITDISDETLDIPVVKFIFQPIIENCIIHGILKLPEIKGDIILKTSLTDDKLIVEISNSSNPIDENLINEINKKLENNDYPSDKHIGLLNVNNRIKLIFGNDYGCQMKYYDGITTVTITLPLDSNM